MSTIQSKVPYDTLIDMWFHFHNEPLNSLVQQSRRYERAYLAWETVRQVRNPFFYTGTGFEGYFVGICQSPDEMLVKLLKIGHQMLISNCRLYRYDFAFKATLMKTLRGEFKDPHAMDVWATLLGAVLGKLRCNVLYNYQTYRFQNETYWSVNRLPPINYTECAHHIEQEYALPQFKNNCVSKCDFSLSALNPSDYDAGCVVSKIGCFGHPLVRAYLKAVNSQGIYAPAKMF